MSYYYSTIYRSLYSGTSSRIVNILCFLFEQFSQEKLWPITTVLV